MEKILCRLVGFQVLNLSPKYEFTVTVSISYDVQNMLLKYEAVTEIDVITYTMLYITNEIFSCPILYDVVKVKFVLSEAKGAPRPSSSRAGLRLPIGHIHRLLRKGHYAERVGAGGPIYLATILEYLAAEILKLAGNVARDNKKTCIIPRHPQLAIRNNEELNKLLGEVTIAQGGALPNIQAVQMSKETGHPSQVYA
ncbi:histone H2A, sperm-like [Carcharodon carcharias]|uniref:histone H2A, sperm-like n=1 Tax=Carcharodon carcharias TaxID=13397 RepID=UPI001B7F0A4E|nr:histone H2A, sperm-like [Carcharodon carcharias]